MVVLLKIAVICRSPQQSGPESAPWRVLWGTWPRVPQRVLFGVLFEPQKHSKNTFWSGVAPANQTKER